MISDRKYEFAMIEFIKIWRIWRCGVCVLILLYLYGEQFLLC